MNTAIILSGGVGSRVTSAEIPKQYVQVAGKPIIWYVLHTVINCKEIENIVVVADSRWRGLVRKHYEDIVVNSMRSGIKLSFAEPGMNRQLSILNALETLEGQTDDKGIVAIIDAARPKMTGHMLTACMEAARQHDGAIPILPMKDTVYLSEDGHQISGLIDREKIYAGQAPEAFKFRRYLEANRALSIDAIMRIHGSSEPAVLAGMDIAMIAGDEDNYKITTDEDLERFRRECEMNWEE